MKIFYSHVLLFVSLFILTSCNGIKPQENTPNQPLTKQEFLLDTVVEISIYEGGNQDVLDQAFELCEYYENKFSKTIETSEVSQINNAGGKPVTVSDETIEILEKSIEYSELSNGCFDITVGSLAELWDFKSAQPQVPTQEEIDIALESVGYENIKIEGNQVTLLNENTQIDLGGVAKGYITDKLKYFLIENGVTSGIINLGGNVFAIGSNASNNDYWKVGIQKPFAEYSEMVGNLSVKDKSVVSSGIYERYFELDGKIYHHILDPKSGYPVENDVLSVTIVSDESIDGDCLSTTCYSLGWENGLELVETMDNVEAIFVLKNGEIKASSGIGEEIPFEYAKD